MRKCLFVVRCVGGVGYDLDAVPLPQPRSLSVHDQQETATSSPPQQQHTLESWQQPSSEKRSAYNEVSVVNDSSQ